MTKVKSNASWNQLTPGQRETLDRWLFEENLGYAAILPRAERELGYKTTLRRYRARREQERTLSNLTEAIPDALEVLRLAKDPDATRKASMQVLAAQLFRLVRSAPEKVKEWAPLARVIMQNDRNEKYHHAREEDRKFKREAQAVAQERYEFDIMEKALKALPELQELAEARRDPQVKQYEENAQWNRLRRALFGPGLEVRPESAQEEAEMLAAKQARGPEAQPERGAIPGVHPPTPSNQYYKEYMKEKQKAGNIQQPTSNIQHPETEKAPSSKDQAPEKHQIPNSQNIEQPVVGEAPNPNLQAPEKLQTSNGENIQQPTSTPTSDVGANAEQPVEVKARKPRIQSPERLIAPTEWEKQAAAERWRNYCMVRKQFDAIKVQRGWTEFLRPPGWQKIEAWRKAPLVWDVQPYDEEMSEDEGPEPKAQGPRPNDQ